MAASGPVLVRISENNSPVSFGAGWNAPRFESSESRVLKWARLGLLMVGLCSVGYFGYTLADEHVYEAYQNWAFEQQIAGHPAVTFSDYVRAKTHLGSSTLTEAGPKATPASADIHSASGVSASIPPLGATLGRLEIPRLHLSAIVQQGSDANTLSRAVGHVPSTALAGSDGNFAIAAHRDTLFRGLKDIQNGDLVRFETPSGGNYDYKVFLRRVVKPSEISVLRPDGGVTWTSANGEGRPRQLLTMITCYPFYYVGSAPERFIVTAERVPDAPVAATLPAPVRVSASHMQNRVPSKSRSLARRKRGAAWRKWFSRHS